MQPRRESLGHGENNDLLLPFFRLSWEFVHFKWVWPQTYIAEKAVLISTAG